MIDGISNRPFYIHQTDILETHGIDLDIDLLENLSWIAIGKIEEWQIIQVLSRWIAIR